MKRALPLELTPKRTCSLPPPATRVAIPIRSSRDQRKSAAAAPAPAFEASLAELESIVHKLEARGLRRRFAQTIRARCATDSPLSDGAHTG